MKTSLRCPSDRNKLGKGKDPASKLQRARVLQTGGLGGRGRPAAANAARERSRVQTLRTAFLELQRTLPSVPPDTKLSKLDVLILATTYIALQSLKGDGYLHPVKRTRAHHRPPPGNRLKIICMKFHLCMTSCCLLWQKRMHYDCRTISLPAYLHSHYSRQEDVVN
uniref:Transcription factor 24 n=1 Tax=Sparus aurata TaxID=8175 RepID=A0A671YMU6_SPAAU